MAGSLDMDIVDVECHSWYVIPEEGGNSEGIATSINSPTEKDLPFVPG